jgi:hypothetical protein
MTRSSEDEVVNFEVRPCMKNCAESRNKVTTDEKRLDLPNFISS